MFARILAICLLSFAIDLIAPMKAAHSQPGLPFTALTEGLQQTNMRVEGERAVRCRLEGKTVIFSVEPYFAPAEQYARVLLYRLQGQPFPFAALTFTREGRVEHVYIDEIGEGKVTRELSPLVLVTEPGSVRFEPNPELVDPKNPRKGIDRCRILTTAYTTRPLP